MTLALVTALRCNLLYYVTSGGRYSFGHNVGHFNFPKISTLPTLLTP